MQRFINNWSTTLIQSATVSDIGIHVDVNEANKLLPGFQQGDYYLLTLDDGPNIEVVKVVAIHSGVLSINRAQEGTIARGWNTETKVEMRITARALGKFETMIDRVLTANGEVLVSPDGNVLSK